MWFSQILEPVLKAIAILISSGLKLVPRLGTGIAEIQEPLSGWAEASNLAQANWSALSKRVFCKNSICGLSQALCLNPDSLVGSVRS